MPKLHSAPSSNVEKIVRGICSLAMECSKSKKTLERQQYLKIKSGVKKEEHYNNRVMAVRIQKTYGSD